MSLTSPETVSPLRRRMLPRERVRSSGPYRRFAALHEISAGRGATDTSQSSIRERPGGTKFSLPQIATKCTALSQHARSRCHTTKTQLGHSSAIDDRAPRSAVVGGPPLLGDEQRGRQLERNGSFIQ